MFPAGFFKKKEKEISAKVGAKGPTPEAQLLAMAKEKYWIVLNSNLLRSCSKDKALCNQANAFKHALQTYGPYNSINLPDFRQNQGKARGLVFHGHVSDSIGTQHILEWTVVDADRRIMALLGFQKHENYPFKAVPLKESERLAILTSPENIKKIDYAASKIKEAIIKVDREMKRLKLS